MSENAFRFPTRCLRLCNRALFSSLHRAESDLLAARWPAIKILTSTEEISCRCSLYIFIYIAEFLGGKLPGRAVMNLKKVCAFASRAFNLSQNFWGEKGQKKTAVTLAGKEKFLSSASASPRDAHLLTPLPVKVNLGLTSCPGGAATDFL